MWNKQRCCWQLQNHVWIQNFRRSNWKLSCSENLSISSWSCDMEVMPRNVWSDIVSWQTGGLNNSTRYQLHALMIIISKKKNWNPWENCQKYTLNFSKMLILGTYWTTRFSMVSEQTCTIDHKNGPRPVTNDYLVWSLTFIIHVITNKIVMWETLQNSADWDCFKTPILLEILRIQNLHQVEHCAFSEAKRTVQQSVGCVRNKLQFRTVQQNQNLIVTVLHGNTHQNDQVRGDPSKSPTRKKILGKIDHLNNVEFISSNVNSSRKEALLFIFEDSEAAIKMIIKGRSPTMRHVSRTHRVALDWLFDRINLDPKIQMKYIDTKNQLADILTKGNFTRDEWNHLLCSFNSSHFSSTDSSEVMSKRTQQESGEDRVTAKSKPMMNLVSRCSERTPDVLPSTASESPVKTRPESQSPLSPRTERHHRTSRPVKDAYSSSYSEWNVDKTWSSQEWKSDELMGR